MGHGDQTTVGFIDSNGRFRVVSEEHPLPTEGGSGGGGAVESVNGETGEVVLTADDIGAEIPEAGSLPISTILNFLYDSVIRLPSSIIFRNSTDDFWLNASGEEIAGGAENRPGLSAMLVLGGSEPPEWVQFADRWISQEALDLLSDPSSGGAEFRTAYYSSVDDEWPERPETEGPVLWVTADLNVDDPEDALVQDTIVVGRRAVELI